MILGEFQWECLAFFTDWRLNFHRFTFSPSVISSERPLAGACWHIAERQPGFLDAASLGPSLAGRCLLGGGLQDGSGLGEEGSSRGWG